MPESPKPDDADRRAPEADWRKRAEEAEREREVLRRERDQLQRETERLRQRIDHLKRQLDDARRAGFRQAAPFAKPLKKDPKQPGRKAGRAYGPKAHHRRPPRVDERYEVLLPAHCPGCAGPVTPTGTATQYQEELPVTRVVVRQFDIQVGRCDRCRRRVQGRHPLQTSDALGAAAAQLGAEVTIAVYVRRSRPATAQDRAVFVRCLAPHRGLTPTGITQIVAAAAQRAGLGTIHAHRLRHFAATQILCAGGSLAEIQQLLRHRLARTTAIYAKVDREALRTIARPWPGGVA